MLPIRKRNEAISLLWMSIYRVRSSVPRTGYTPVASECTVMFGSVIDVIDDLDELFLP